jgi:phosphatidylglycerol:prolipoprotein diacylglycerol transferase
VQTALGPASSDDAMTAPSVITIGIDPEFQVGPITVAWHGITILVGILIGGAFAAARYARERGLRTDELMNVGLVMLIAGLVGAKAFFLLENDTAALLRPGEWLSSRGFAFNGSIILVALAVAAYLRWRRLPIDYLDAVAVGFPLGMAIGRIGDVINGEHYGPRSDLPWAVRNSHPDALTPDRTQAYHSGGLYEVVLAAVIFAVVWPLRDRFRRPTIPLWTVVALYGIGRFVMFFARSDSEPLALGLDGSQWTSVGLVAVATIRLLVARRRRLPPPLELRAKGRAIAVGGRGEAD